VFHDDQHGTAVVTLAALQNALQDRRQAMDDLRVVISGIGAAGVAIGKMLLEAGVDQRIVGVDRRAPSTTGRRRSQPVPSSGSPRTPTPSRSGRCPTSCRAPTCSSA
jgi:malic enzyme